MDDEHMYIQLFKHCQICLWVRRWLMSLLCAWNILEQRRQEIISGEGFVLHVFLIYLLCLAARFFKILFLFFVDALHSAAPLQRDVLQALVLVQQLPTSQGLCQQILIKSLVCFFNTFLATFWSFIILIVHHFSPHHERLFGILWFGIQTTCPAHRMFDGIISESILW